MIEPESDVVKDADSSVDKDVQMMLIIYPICRITITSISMIKKKWILKLPKTLIRVLIIALE